MSFSSFSEPKEVAVPNNKHSFIRVAASGSSSGGSSGRRRDSGDHQHRAAAATTTTTTIEKHPSVSQSITSRTPVTLTPAFFELVCDETMRRTQLQCDEMTSFQRIVSFRVAEMHGRWGFSLEAQEADQFCAVCGGNMDLRKRMASIAHGQPRTLDLCGKRLDTPCCGLKELYGEGCKYADEVAGMLQRRADFHRQFSPITERMRKASEGIRDTVDAYIL